jgi:lactobin A/cerein 7B family class IIb bacteriocin
MASLDTLATFGTELTAEQLEDADGGILPVLVAVGFFVVGYGIGKNLP